MCSCTPRPGRASDFTLKLETEDSEVRRLVYTTSQGEGQSRTEIASLELLVNPEMGVDELMAKTGLGRAAAYKAIEKSKQGRKKGKK